MKECVYRRTLIDRKAIFIVLSCDAFLRQIGGRAYNKSPRRFSRVSAGLPAALGYGSVGLWCRAISDIKHLKRKAL